jgi:hypothetical protein
LRVETAPLSRDVTPDDGGSSDRQPLTVALRPEHVALALGSIITCFVFAHAALQTVAIVSGHDYLFGLVPLFDLDAEQNLPTLFSAALFLAGAVLSAILWTAGRVEGSAEIMWFILAGVFAFLGMDEFFAWHERLVSPIRSAFQTSGLLYFAWVIPYALTSIVLGLALVPLLRRIEPPVRNYLILSGVVYVVGAVGFEMLGGWYYEGLHTKKTFMWVALTTLEELLEMIGLSLLVYALLVHIVARHGGFAILLTTSSPQGSTGRPNPQRTIRPVGAGLEENRTERFSDLAKRADE